MDFSDYPALYKSADSGSNKAQARFLWTVRSEYFLLVLLALASSSAVKYSGAWVISLLLASLLTMLLIYRFFSDNDIQWYRCRALAESVKTASWRFACRAHPYESVDDVKAAVRNFLSDLNAIRTDNEFIGKALDERFADLDQITGEMFRVRGLPVEERLNFYLEERVQDQREWYAKKAKYNKTRKRAWFGIMILSYLCVFGSIVAGHFSIFETEPLTNALVVGITSSIGWIQVKRHGELSVSYLLAAHEIGSLIQRKDEVDSEEALSDYVNTAELAFSREHTQWAARASAM